MTLITRNMDFLDWEKAWLAKAKEKGHELALDRYGSVNVFAINFGLCNGPACRKCGWSACMHCDFLGERIPQCTTEV